MGKQLKLKAIELINFKGVRSSRIEFTDQTNIYGENRTGKSTHTDAIYFCLFGKNADDQSKFGIKTFDESGNVIPHLDHSVKLFMTVNGEEEVFERIIEESWQKPHGETERVYKGDKTILKINDIPVKVNEFNSKVGAIISDEMFKVLSNPLYFNQIHWEKRREVLIKIAGETSNEEILNGLINGQNEPDYVGLITALSRGDKASEYRKGLRDKIKTLSEEESGIKHRIAEVDQGKPEAKDWILLEGKIKDLKTELEAITQALIDRSKKQEEKQKKRADLSERIGNIKLEIQKLENELKLEANKQVNENKVKHAELAASISRLEVYIRDKKQSIANKEKEVEELNEELPKLRKAAEEAFYEVFVLDKDFTCPTCKQSLPSETIETQTKELEENFNTSKARKIEDIKNTGKAKAEKVKLLELEIQQTDKLVTEQAETLNTIIAELESLNIEEIPVVFSSHKGHVELNNQMEELIKEYDSIVYESDSESEKRKEQIQVELVELEKEYRGKEAIEKADNRIAELMLKKKDLNQQIADLEREESAVISFEKAKMDILEEKVNSKFKLCKFRMFEPQKNGGEKPDCVTLINGVPFNDANTESKINAGLDVINVMSEHYQIFVPIIIDNRESVTEILPVKSQVVNLYKDSNYKTLTVK